VTAFSGYRQSSPRSLRSLRCQQLWLEYQTVRL